MTGLPPDMSMGMPPDAAQPVLSLRVVAAGIGGLP
jgi:hypothetical protein